MFKGYRLPKSIIIQAVYFKFGLGYEEIKELMSIGRGKVDHTTI